MSNTLTIEQLRDSLEETIARVKDSGTPVKLVSNGRTAAFIVSPDNMIVYDPLITREEAAELARGLAQSEADIAAGRVYTAEEAWERLRAACEARGEIL